MVDILCDCSTPVLEYLDIYYHLYACITLVVYYHYFATFFWHIDTPLNKFDVNNLILTAVLIDEYYINIL